MIDRKLWTLKREGFFYTIATQQISTSAIRLQYKTKFVRAMTEPGRSELEKVVFLVEIEFFSR